MAIKHANYAGVLQYINRTKIYQVLSNEKLYKSTYI